MVAWSGAYRAVATARAPDAWAKGYLVAGSVVMAAYVTLPHGGLLPWWGWSLLLYGGLGFSAVAAVLTGVHHYRPAPVVAWWLLAAGLLGYILGDVLYDVSAGAFAEGGFGGVYDLFYLASYPFMMAGLLLMIRGRSPGSDRTTLIDALVIAGGAGFLAWALLLGPLAREPGLTLPVQLLSFAYPVGDLLMLVMAARLAAGGGRRWPAAWLLVVGVTGALCSDSAFTYGQLVGGWQEGGLGDLGWMVWYTCWGAAALHPSMARLSDPVPAAEARLGPARLWLLAGALLVSPVVLAVQAVRGSPLNVPVVAITSGVLALLVLARMAGLAGRIAEQVAERRLLLDRTVQATEEERVRIAANLHDGPIQRLAALGYTASGARRRVERGEPADTEALASLEGGIRDEVAALRQVMAELRPPVLDELGLAAALDAYGDDFRQRCGIACVVRTSSDVRLRPSLETLVCRLVHEALINVEKHAAARAVEISLAVEPGRARLEVSDDGVGFDVARAIGRDHFGLASMRQRVETAGGSWGIHSHPGRGTTITARLPTG